MTTSESRPSIAARTASSCPGRKARKPKCWWREVARSIASDPSAGSGGYGRAVALLLRVLRGRCTGVEGRTAATKERRGEAGPHSCDVDPNYWGQRSESARAQPGAATPVDPRTLSRSCLRRQRPSLEAKTAAQAQRGAATATRSIANFPRAALVRSSGKSPEKQASQWESRGAWIAS